ncbi:MAG: GAF domain-containing protein, partial [Pseudomonadales bacterium]|nr:GAF domain-containing protein [Pseudomonadales bacterium]
LQIQKEISELDSQRAQFDEDWGLSTDHPLLAFYVRMMTRLVKAERCSIFIHDPVTESVWLKCATELPERAIEVDPDTNSVVGEVISTGEAIIDNDMQNRDGYHKSVEAETGFQTRHLMCLPIKSLDGERVMGAVQLLNKTEGDGFTDEDKATVLEMAHFLEMGVENIYFNQHAVGVVHRLVKTVKGLTMALTVVAVAIVGRVVWVGFMGM